MTWLHEISRTSTRLIAAALVGGLVLTAALSYFSILKLQTSAMAKLNEHTAWTQQRISRRLEAGGESVHGLATLFNASLEVDFDQFGQFAADIQQRHGYITQAYYLPLVRQAERDAMQTGVRERGFPAYSIKHWAGEDFAPAKNAARYLPVLYVEPYSPRSATMLGLDFLSIDAYRAVIEQAVLSAETMALPAVHDPKASGTYLVIKAVYAGKHVPEEVMARKQGINALVALEIDMRAVIMQTLDGMHDSLALVDLDAGAGKTITHIQTTRPDTQAGWTQTRHALQSPIQFAGRRFEMRSVGRIDWLALGYETVALAASTGAALTGLLISLLLGIFGRTRELERRNADIQAVVHTRTEELNDEKRRLEAQIEERKKAEAESLRLHRILDESSDEIFIIDAKSLRVLHANQGALNNLGYSMEHMLQMTVVDLLVEEERAHFVEAAEVLGSHGIGSRVLEGTHLRSDGSRYPVEMRLRRSQAANGPVLLAFVMDIGERLRSRAHMARLSGALEQTSDIVMITDPRGILEYVNPAFEQTTGYTRKEAVGRKANILNSGRHPKAFYAKLWTTIMAGKDFREVVINRKKDGSVYYEEKTITPLKNERGEIVNFVSTAKDISERMKAQEHLHYLAHHDKLTGLPNRAMFMDRLRQTLARSQRSQREFTVFFLDLDRFKNINDTLGHDAGDALLQEVALRLSECVRQSDTVARLGGDEFTILFEETGGINNNRHIAEKILHAFAKPIQLKGHELFVTTSIGIAAYPTDGEEAHVLLKHADVAMYKAKDAGKNTYRFYTAQMGEIALHKLQLESSLRRALERGEFVLHYQPQTDVFSSKVIGVEALLRWERAGHGLVPPADFIPLLEETGLINAVGKWVLEEACAQAQRWQALDMEPIRISVNLSGRQFNNPRLVEIIAQVLRDTSLPPQWLELELTESTVMSNAEEAARVLKQIGGMGVGIAIDDFGTGYSSLGYLKRFPIDTLKIDRSFVRDIASDPDDEAIVRTIIQMAQGLRLRVVAEGVERPEQVTFLRECGCRYIQGYLYGKPLGAEAMTEWLTNPQAHKLQGSGT